MARSRNAPVGLVRRKLADTSDGERVKRFDPETGEAYLADPATWDRDNPGTWEPKPWPSAGFEIVGGPPRKLRVPTSSLAAWKAEGFAIVEGETVEHAPGGPAENEWKVTHTFVHVKAFTLKTVNGDYRYTVTQQPGKYADKGEPSGQRVDWFYDADLDEA